MRWIWILVWASGCVGARKAPVPAPQQAPEAVARGGAQAIQVSDLRDLRCTAGVCTISTATHTRSLDPATLRLGEISVGTSPGPQAVVLDENPPKIAARWNRQIAAGWRSPFQEAIPTPTDGRVSYVRSLASDRAQLLRTGGKMRAHPAPRAEGPVAYRRWLALHPTGQQAYLAPWPHTEIIALDPDRLLTGWRLDLGEPTLGLFVDPTGQYLIGESGGSTDLDRLLDFSGDPIAVPEGVDPVGDPHLAQIPRPVATHTVIVDLSKQDLVARLPGTYLRWVPLEGQVLIATTSAIARLPLD